MSNGVKIAVVETGGKQYLVSEGKKIYVEKLSNEAGLPAQAGAKFDFDKVLLTAKDAEVEIGRPYLSGKKVSAELLEQKRLPKVTIFRYHSKTRYRKKKGHRQHVSVVKILGIK